MEADQCTGRKVRDNLVKQLACLQKRNTRLRQELPDSSVKPEKVLGRPDMKQMFSAVGGPKRRQSLKVACSFQI
jgi:hypothetical protein